MKKILLSLLLAGGVQYSFAMQGGGGGAAAQGGAAQSDLWQLIGAVKEGNVAAVRALLESGANVNAQLANGSAALMTAAFNGHAEIVRALLAGGANVNLQNANGSTALTFAAERGHVEVVRVLLEGEANVDLQTKGGSTALMIAAEDGHAEVVKALLAGGADVNAQAAQAAQSANGWTALMAAANKGHVEAVKALLERGANVNAQDAQGSTALMYAANKGHVEVVRVLLEGGPNVNAQTAQGRTALMEAANEGHAEVVKALLAGGANVDLQTKQGGTALMYAALKGHVEVVRNLLASCADVNKQDSQGWTALMEAAQNGHVEVVIALLDKGADVNLKDSKGKTAIDYATGKKEIIELLKKQMPKPVNGKKASKASTVLPSAGGGVARASGGATKNVEKTLCATVAAKTLKEAGTQTESIQVGSSQATAQKRLLSSSPKSAFSKPRLSGKPSSASQMACDEARASGGIVVPIAVRPGATSFVGLQPNIAPHVAAPQVFSLKPLILEARANGTGLSGLIQLLNRSEHDAFDAFEAEGLVKGLRFNASIFEQANYKPITGLELALLLTNRISIILGPEDAASVLTEDQATNFKILETLFERLP